jgi:glycosyltransferase involved in cell wall biosynthesis
MRIAMLLHKSVEFDSRVRREASALAEAGHTVVVLELASDAAGARQLDGFERLSVLPPPWIWPRLRSVVYRPVMLLWFIRGLLATQPDVVHAHDAAMLLPGIVGARLTGARLVYDSHELATSVPYRERGWAWFVGMIERLVVPRCAAVITVSDGIAARLRDRYALSTIPTVVRNVCALEPNGRGTLREKLGLGPEAPLVLHQGAPAPSRGCEVLVDAIAQLEGVHLAFLGDPEPGYGQELSGEIRARGIADRVSFLPNVSLGELLANTAEADVGVTLLQDSCDNHRLALPNKLFEYIAAGLPVVASALPETEKLVEAYGVGWCVPPDRPDALALALRRALSARNESTLRQRLAHAADDLQWGREQTRLLDLYRGLEAERPTRSPGPTLLLVRNTVSHDARVLRAARTALREPESEAVIIGVAGESSPREESVGAVRIRRLRAPQRPGWSLRTRASSARESTPGEVAEPASDLAIRARLRRAAVGAAFIVQSVSVARRHRPAVVHANDWNTMWAGVAIKLLCGSGLIYDSHELWAERNGRWESRVWLSACESLFVRLADEVITTSPGHASYLEWRYRIKRPLVIRNIPEWRATASHPPRQPPVTVYIGGLMPGRGLEQMIDALPHIPEVRLRAVGPGSAAYRAWLWALAEATGVADRVELADAVPTDRVERELAGAAAGVCLIQPVCLSYELSLPNKLLEYVAAGIPILASDLPVIAEVVGENDLGEVVTPNDPWSIADGMIRLLDPERRSRVIASARRFASANSWSRESGRLAEVYARARRNRR